MQNGLSSVERPLNAMIAKQSNLSAVLAQPPCSVQTNDEPETMNEQEEVSAAHALLLLAKM